MERADIPQIVDVTYVEKSESQPEIVTVTSVPAPARVPIAGYITEEGEHVYRWGDTADVDVRAVSLIEALEQLAELADPHAVNRLIEVFLNDLAPARLSRIREAVYAISKIEAALKSRHR